ncbi:hypothetical protein PHYSODRAFT_331055 [Phytophthora sojae]|uniref:Uncharacterized protein n=1 Tax=Phytophthora sojae (strain P6497) TaxID=1094619 RepID=G4ZFD2_PHYSP|nr:hypothetical protein PHYSODRAFT_331055 [Phytophthora sojae]EGZ17021.1 hypothetical protein PHYSODRAFT_331055 [Phytophthora sojae]|eukprot:XP_009526079.1 hypothetical protein PHYSODRAFT_331055 [Phytophthora sojae]
MPATGQQRADVELKTAAMLEEMIKSTHQLDEILQRLCAADSTATVQGEQTIAPVDSVGVQDADSDSFEDCIGSPTSDGVELTAEEYFQNTDFGDANVPMKDANFQMKLGNAYYA